jgi:hypothetical protein
MLRSPLYDKAPLYALMVQMAQANETQSEVAAPMKAEPKLATFQKWEAEITVSEKRNLDNKGAKRFEYGPFSFSVQNDDGILRIQSKQENGEHVDISVCNYSNVFSVNVEGASFCEANRGYWQGVKEEYKPKAKL